MKRTFWHGYLIEGLSKFKRVLLMSAISAKLSTSLSTTIYGFFFSRLQVSMNKQTTCYNVMVLSDSNVATVCDFGKHASNLEAKEA